MKTLRYTKEGNIGFNFRGLILWVREGRQQTVCPWC